MKIQKKSEINLSANPLYSLTVDPKEKFLYAGGLDKYLTKVNYQKESSEIYKIEGLNTSIYASIFDSDHSRLWLAGGKGILQGLEKGSVSLRIQVPLANTPIFCLGLIPRSTTLLAGIGNGELKIINTEILENINFEPQAIQTLKISQEAIRVIAFHPNKPLLALGGKDTFIYLLNSDTLEVIMILKSHSLPVFSLAFSPNGQFLVSGSRDASLKIWDLSIFKLAHSIPAHLFAVNHILFHPTEPYFVSASMDKSIKVWGSEDFVLYKILNQEKIKGHTSSVNRMAWLEPEGNTLASISDDRRLIFWEFDF